MIIYGLIDPLSLCVRYVGVTNFPHRRLKEHLKERGKCHRIHWLSQLKAMKLVPTLVHLVDTSEETWQDDERHMIALLRALGADLINDTDGGDGGPMSAEARARMSASHKGKTLSEAHKSAIGKAHKGRRMTKEHRDNLSKAAKRPSQLERLRQMAADARAAKARKQAAAE